MNDPKLRTDLTLIPHSTRCVEARVGAWNATSITIEWNTGNLLQFLRALDGKTSVQEAARRSQASASNAQDLVIQLKESGLLSSGTNPDSIDFYLASSALAYGRTTASLQSTHAVTVVGDGFAGRAVLATLADAKLDVLSVPTATLEGIAQGAREWLTDGLEFERRASALKEVVGDRLLVYVPDQVNPAHASILGNLCHAAGTTWMHSAIDGPLFMIGPLFLSGAVPCFECFETRMLMNLRNASSYVKYKELLLAGDVVGGVPRMPPVLAALHAALVSVEVCHYAHTGTGFTFRKCLTLYTPTFEFAFSEVMPLASCRVCGVTSERDAASLYGDIPTYERVEWDSK